ncbi:MAG: cobalamin-dependent protein [Proteobacteria bacterium]|nr:cobalamin-dependent protein [Pseudomonadota bacterium]
MPDASSPQQTNTGSHNFKPVSRSALDLFTQALPKLLVFVNEKFHLENKFLCDDACCKNEGLIEDFNRKLGNLLTGIYEFSLFEHFADEFSWLVAEQESRGLNKTFLESDLKAWMLGINSMIKRPESAELVQPIECMCRYMPAVYAQLEAAESPLDEKTLKFIDLLLRKSRKFAAEYILSLIREGATIEHAYTRVLLPALTHVRLLWRKNKISAADENVASDICRYTIFRVVDSIFSERKYPFKVLVACVPEEEDVLGAEVFANFMEIRGWSIYFIGHGFSAEDIIHAIETNKPQVVVLSAVSIAWLPAARKLIEQVRQTDPQVKIVLEGQAVLRARDHFKPMVDGIVSGFEDGQKIMLAMVMPRA